MQMMDSRLPSAWPPELPLESAQDFWFHVAQIEMTMRNIVSAKTRLLIAADDVAMTALEAWLYRRRVEWAAQIVLTRVKLRVEPHVPLSEVLDWLLIGSWESDGCIGLWNHAERGGKPHPNNPDGMTPI
jgi:hypothetical protein